MKGFGRHHKCHYCASLATTRDHIVPASLMRRWAGDNRPVDNLVPSCEPCNVHKGQARSTCDCEDCTAAWEFYGRGSWRQFPRVDPATCATPNGYWNRKPHLTRSIGEQLALTRQEAAQ